MSKKQFDAALPVFEQLQRDQPGDPNRIYDAARINFLARNYNAVIAILAPHAAQFDPEALDLLGKSYAVLDRPEQAIQILQQAIAANPNEPNYYVHLTNACLPVRQFAAALQTLNSAIKRLPHAARLYVARGIVHAEMARYEDAEADFKAAEQIDPQVESGSAAVGLTELQRHDLPQAETAVRERLRRNSNDATLHYVLAEAITQKGAAPGSPEFLEAIRSAELAVSEQPSLSVAHDVWDACIWSRADLPMRYARARWRSTSVRATPQPCII